MSQFVDDDDDEDDKTVIIKSAVRAQPPQGRLVCMQPGLLEGDTGVEIRLVYGEVTVGRAASNIAVVNADGVAETHLKVVPSDSAWTVEDAGSPDGVTVNDHKIERQTRLQIGDVVKIGPVPYKVELFPPGEEPWAESAAAKPAPAKPAAAAPKPEPTRPPPRPEAGPPPAPAQPGPGPTPAPPVVEKKSSAGLIIAVVLVAVVIAVVVFVL